MPGIKTTITDHFKMFLRYMPDKAFDEVHNGESFFHIGIIFVSVIVKGHIFAIIFVNARCGNDGSAKVTPDIFDHSIRVTFIGLGIYVKSMFIVTVAEGFGFLKRRTYYTFHFIEKSGAECISEIGIVEMPDIFPETIVTEAAFGQKTMNVRVPFQVTSKCGRTIMNPGV